MGLGVWPDRPPPRPWERADLFKMMFEYQTTGRVRPLVYSVLRVTGAQPVRLKAQSMMTSTGTVVSIWGRNNGEEFLGRAKEELLPAIVCENFRIMPFYVPLLDFASLRDRKAEELERWLCGATVYVRESPGDNAIIVLANLSLVPPLEEAGAKPTDSGRWIFS